MTKMAAKGRGVVFGGKITYAMLIIECWEVKACLKVMSVIVSQNDASSTQDRRFFIS